MSATRSQTPDSRQITRQGPTTKLISDEFVPRDLSRATFHPDGILGDSSASAWYPNITDEGYGRYSFDEILPGSLSIHAPDSPYQGGSIEGLRIDIRTDVTGTVYWNSITVGLLDSTVNINDPFDDWWSVSVANWTQHGWGVGGDDRQSNAPWPGGIRKDGPQLGQRINGTELRLAIRGWYEGYAIQFMVTEWEAELFWIPNG